MKTNPVPYKYFLLIAALSLFLSFFRLGSITLFDVDEAVFAEATKEMVQSGDWITPTYNGENRYDKPILFYWLMAVSYKVFGINEFGARFPSAFLGVLLCLSIFLFAKRIFDDEQALHASLAFALSPYYLAYSHAAVTDMTLSLFIGLSLFSFYLSMREDRRYIYGFYLFSALAFLTKGLIGIVFPFGIVLLYLLVTEGMRGVRRAADMRGILLFVVVSFPWYSAQYLINGQEFIQQFIVKHHFTRYTGVVSGHRGPVYYYIPAIIAGVFPWIAYLPQGIREVFRGTRSLKDIGNIGRGENNHGLFFLLWFGVIFLFFSFSTTKLPNYILPAMPAVAILISNGMKTAKQSRMKQNMPDISGMRKRYADIFIAVISALSGAAFLMSGRYLSEHGITDINWTFAAASLLFVLSFIGFYGIWKNKRLYGYIATVMICFFTVLVIGALPAANTYLQGTLHKYSLYAKSRLHKDEQILTYRLNNPSIVFYSERRIINARGKDKLFSVTGNESLRIVIAKTKDVGLLEEAGFTLLEKDDTYALLERN